MLKAILITVLLSLAILSNFAKESSKKAMRSLTKSYQSTISVQPCTPYPLCKIWKIESQEMASKSSDVVQLSLERKERRADMNYNY